MNATIVYHISVFLILLVAVCFAIYTKFRKHPLLTGPSAMIAFLFKVAMGCLYGYIFGEYYNGDDTWELNKSITMQGETLYSSPLQFFLEPIEDLRFFRERGFKNGLIKYLQLMEVWLLTKPLALFYIITKGSYYTNIILFNSVAFTGHYFFYKVCAAHAHVDKRLLYLIIFFFPPAAFWLSGLRGDAMIFTFAALTIFYALRWFSQPKKKWLFAAILGLAMVVVFRFQFGLLLLAALVAGYISSRSRWYVGPAAVYGLVLMLTVVSGIFRPINPVLQPIVRTQHDFLSLHGNTRFRLDSLEPKLVSFVQVAPQALENTLLRPYPWEASGLLQKIACAETIFVLAVILAVIFFHRKFRLHKEQQPLFITLLCFAISSYFLIGLTVPFPGAIIRYRIVAELFILTAIALSARHHLKKKDNIYLVAKN